MLWSAFLICFILSTKLCGWLFSAHQHAPAERLMFLQPGLGWTSKSTSDIFFNSVTVKDNKAETSSGPQIWANAATVYLRRTTQRFHEWHWTHRGRSSVEQTHSASICTSLRSASGYLLLSFDPVTLTEPPSKWCHRRDSQDREWLHIMEMPLCFFLYLCIRKEETHPDSAQVFCWSEDALWKCMCVFI